MNHEVKSGAPVPCAGCGSTPSIEHVRPPVPSTAFDFQASCPDCGECKVEAFGSSEEACVREWNRAQGEKYETPMIDYEREILRKLCDGTPLNWGAAVGVAIEALRGRGYVLGTSPTWAGRAYIQGWRDCESQRCPAQSESAE